MRKFLAIGLVLLLAGCATVAVSPEVRDAQRITQACAVYDGTLRSLAIMRAGGKLSDAQIAVVNQWRPILNGICIADDVPDIAASGLLDTLEKALLELNGLKGAS